MIRVGLLLPLQGLWQGGVNYFHNLLSCYQQFPDAALQLEVFTDKPEDVERYRCEGIEVHACPEVSACHPWYSPQRVISKVLDYDPLLLKIMKRHKIDLLTHRSVGKQADINTLQWLPDLQHKAFPQYFSESTGQT